jgi:type IV secretion system protein VirD4
MRKPKAGVTYVICENLPHPAKLRAGDFPTMKLSARRVRALLPVCLSLAVLVVLAGCSHNAAQFDDGSGFLSWVSEIVGHLGAGIAGAILGAACGAFFSQRAKPVRKWLGVATLWVSLGASVLGSFLTSSFFSGLLGFIAGGIAAYMALRIGKVMTTGDSPKKSKPVTFGSAEWADLEHLKEHDLVGKAGFSLGFYEHEGQMLPLQYTGDRHLLTIAPTRTGKGVSAIIPNLLTYTGSVVVIDPKGENAMVTADRRGKGTASIKGLGQRVYVVDPWEITGIKPARFNPLTWLCADDLDVSENAMMLADSLVVGGNAKEPFWDEEAKALLMGILLYVALDERENEQRTLGRVRDIIVLPEDEFNEVLLRMGDNENPIIRSTAARTSAKDGRMLSNVMASLQSHTHFLDSPRIRESLSASDFDFANLKAGGMSVYLVLPADRIDTFGRWLRLLIQQAITVNARNIEQQPEKPILFLLDEMAALGKLTMVAQAFGLMAGFGMQLWGIVQDLSQLERIYEHGWQTFIGNSGVLQYFGSRDQKTAEYFSKLCGMQTVEKTSLTKSISETISSVVSRSQSESTATDTTQRPLMFTDELMMMRGNKQVVLVENFNAIPAHKLPWFENPELARLGHNLRTENRQPVITVTRGEVLPRVPAPVPQGSPA